MRCERIGQAQHRRELLAVNFDLFMEIPLLPASEKN